MIDKREVEEIVLSQIPTKDRSCGWPAFWRDIVVPYREKELIAALTKISQLEQQLDKQFDQLSDMATRLELAGADKAQLEQQILEIQGNAAIRFAEAEARWHKAEEFLDAVDSTLCSCRFDDKPGCNCDIHHAHKLVAQYRQDSAAEGGRG